MKEAYRENVYVLKLHMMTGSFQFWEFIQLVRQIHSKSGLSFAWPSHG